MPILHIHNGDSSAGTARELIPGEHIAWREVLVAGPTPANLSGDEWRKLRAAYLSNTYELAREKCERDLRAQEQKLSRYAEYEETVLWFEHDLFCQANLIYLLNWFARQRSIETQLSMVCIGEFPGIKNFRGLGELNADQLASLFPQRRPIAAEQLDLGSRAWAAYSSPNPTAIESLL